LIYLDSSALIKLVLPEPESAALEGYLARSDGQLASSKLAITEVHRALLRIDATDDDRAAADELLRLPVQQPGTVPPARKRS
jgi:predicted nucleic acid-binding protein